MGLNSGWIILLIPIVGLNLICKNGRWNWNVFQPSKLITVLFWVGWFTSLIVGLGRVIGLFS